MSEIKEDRLQQVSLYHVTTVDALDLILKYGLYGSDWKPMFADEESIGTPDSGFAYSWGNPRHERFFLVIKTLQVDQMKRVIYGEPQYFLPHVSVSSVPAEFLEELRGRGIRGLSTGVSNIFEVLRDAMSQDEVGWIPPDAIDINRSIVENRRFFGVTFNSSKFYQKLRANL